ncbi:MAG TPA: hypothetical protein VFD66_08685, partial [Verrucomicrobiae bacterium]|nr:hypothetical protein [Verrucomicrobiae bacterium]
VNVQSARDFITWAQREKEAQDWQVEGWKEAIRWFFWAAKLAAGCRAGAPATAPDPGCAGGSAEARSPGRRHS